MDSEDIRIARGFDSGEKDSIRIVDSWIISVIRSEKWFDRLAECEEDVFQEVRYRFTVALREKRITGQGPLKAFVQKTAMHVCIDWLRKQRELPKPPEVIEWLIDRTAVTGSDPLETVILRQLIEGLKVAISALSPAEQDLIRMSFYEGMLHREIAERLGVADGTVKSRKSRHLEKLGNIFLEIIGEGNGGGT
jgi:RNA polymerase sigma factor (sigma-70 family)